MGEYVTGTILDEWYTADSVKDSVEGSKRLVARVKPFLDEWRSSFFEGIRHESGGGGIGLAGRYCCFIDEVIVALVRVAHRRFEPEASGGSFDCGVVLAVGGYGRGELSPHSDIDILFLSADRQHIESGIFSQVSKKVLYLLWDTGFNVGHGFRTVNDCTALSATDFASLTSLLESRLLYGSGSLHRKLQKSLFGRDTTRNINTFIETTLQDRNSRHKRYEYSINLQEPNVKESPGGLRDYHLVLWIGRARLGITDVADLVGKGVLSNAELDRLMEAVDFLLSVRNRLHLISGARSDVIAFEKQQELAKLLGFKDSRRRLGVEKFMRQVYINLNNIYGISQIVLKKMVKKKRPIFFRRKRKIAGRPGFYSSDGVLYFNLKEDCTAAIKAAPSLLLGIFRICQDNNLELSEGLGRAIRSNIGLVDDSYRNRQENIDNFISILTGRRIYKTLRQMHDLRVLGEFVPEFIDLTCHMRFDMYHMFTIDEHILLGIKYLEDLRHEAPLKTLGEAYAAMGQDESLKIAFFLHDFGKVSKENHAEKSVEISRAILKRWNIEEGKTGTILFLVEQHLLMSHTAQRCNLHDPDVITRFLSIVGGMERLHLLYLLTYTDIRSVGHNAWSSWTGMLLEELFIKSSNRILDKKGDDPESKRLQLMEMFDRDHAELVESVVDNMPEGYLVQAGVDHLYRYIQLVCRLKSQLKGRLKVQSRKPAGKLLDISISRNIKIGYLELMVCTRNQKGVLAKIAGVVTALGYNILGAHVCTQSDNLAVDTIQIVHKKKGSPLASDTDEASIKEVLGSVICGRKTVESLLVRQKRYFSDKTKQNALIVTTRVSFNNGNSRRYTEIQISAADRIGLLYKITRIMFEYNISIYSAKIATEGLKAIDTFYVSDANGLKIYNESVIKQLQAVIIACLEQADTVR